MPELTRRTPIAVRISPLLMLLAAGWTAAVELDSSIVTPGAGPVQDSVFSAIAAVKPALVKIDVVSFEYMGGREIKYESTGSGVIVTPEGHVVTNHHVAGKAHRIVCTMSDRREVPGTLVGADPLTDIAVIKLADPANGRYPCAHFGNSAHIKVGDRVLAMGSPLALSQSVTMGIISNRELTMPKEYWPFDRIEIEGEDVGSLVVWIGHDAPIFPGNSGGPLVTLDGKIIGINEIDMGIAAAIPGNLANNVAQQLMKRGKITRSWLGLEAQPLLKGQSASAGVLISGTIENSPARNAGLLPGDILAKIDGKETTVRYLEELPDFNAIISSLSIGKDVKAEIVRNGKKTAVTVTPQEREYVNAKPQELLAWGLTVSPISLMQAKEMKRGDQKGVLVTSLRPGGPCDQAIPPIEQNDVIVAVGEAPIASVGDLIAFTKKALVRQEDRVPVLVTFERKQEQFLTVAKIGVNELEDKGLEVRKAWLPVSMQVLTSDIAEQLGIKGRTGMRITQVYPGSSAQKGGLRVGDIITAIDKEPIAASEPEDEELLPALVRRYKIGSTAALTILREKKEQVVKVELASSPRPAKEMEKYRDVDFEFTVRDISVFDKARESWQQNQQGVLVDAVEQGGWAALGMLAVGDLMLTLDGDKIVSVADVEKAMKKIAEKKAASVILQVRRGIHTLFVELEPDWKK
jgi:serine protease Do